MTDKKHAEEAVLRAIRLFKEGRVPDEKCVYCAGVIQVAGAPPGGPFTQFYFTCPCKQTSGFLKGI